MIDAQRYGLCSMTRRLSTASGVRRRLVLSDGKNPVQQMWIERSDHCTTDIAFRLALIKTA